jgi:hypothetical protein
VRLESGLWQKQLHVSQEQDGAGDKGALWHNVHSIDSHHIVVEGQPWGRVLRWYAIR